MRRGHLHGCSMSLQRRSSKVHHTHVHVRARAHTSWLGHATLQPHISCLRCRRQAGHTNGWSSRTSAAYPADMNLALARTFASLLQVSALGQIPVPEVAGVEMQIPPTVAPTAETPMPPAPVQAPHAPHAPPEAQSEPAPQPAQEDSASPAAAPPPASPRKPSKPSTWERTGHPLRSSLRSAAHLTTGGSVPRIGHALASFGVSKLATS